MQAMLWDLNDGKHLYTLDHADTINGLCFSPNRCVCLPLSAYSVLVLVFFYWWQCALNLL
jgi:hypothetical protein